jgi:uncharacterized protein involved in tellurium resistance
MKPQNIDLILLVDASESMKPCFAQLREHLNDLLFPLQQANFKVRFGLVAYAAGRNGSEPIYDHTFIGGSGPEMIQKLYGQSPQAADFFTSDSTGVTKRLAGLQAQGNEDTLLALDIAADFPFGPVESTRRVVAVFTDETIEAGISGEEPLAKMAELIQKLTTRRIQLFVSAPHSPALEELGSVDRAEIETVDGGDGLKSVDFKKLLAQMGKSISVSSLQMGSEPPWKKAIYGQDRWTSSKAVSNETRSTILGVGEVAYLDATNSIRNLRIRMEWTRGDTFLDIYAIYMLKSGSLNEVYFGKRSNGDGIFLSEDPSLSETNKFFDMTIDCLDNFEDMLIAANIYNKSSDRWSNYDGQVIMETTLGEKVITRLTAQEVGCWCVISRIDNRQAKKPKIINLNKVTFEKPAIIHFI